MSNLHPYYLQTMGIETWVVREKATQDKLPNHLNLLQEKVSNCNKCPLHKTRRQTVFARGNEKASLMLIGEAPGFYEDKQGLPFVGKAGQLLNQMMEAIGLSENDIYIANVLKCRPPDNRDPLPEEIVHCSSYLKEQIDYVKPQLILALGRFAGQFLMNQMAPLKDLRNKIHSFQNIPFIVTYHPAYLLRNPQDKKKAYSDLLFAKQNLKDN
ncbi:MAG: uracil-DNA glycosylase [Proteobacteria bacterium]|nr:uracil-DNA glycosylase [Pseudomonadota bacterium]